MAAFDGPTLAKMGLLKMDMLGLIEPLDCGRGAELYRAAPPARRMELTDIPLDDKRSLIAWGAAKRRMSSSLNARA